MFWDVSQKVITQLVLWSLEITTSHHHNMSYLEHVMIRTTHKMLRYLSQTVMTQLIFWYLEITTTHQHNISRTEQLMIRTAQEWTNRTLAVHERVDSRSLVLPGSKSTITEITEYLNFSPLKPCREFEYKSELNTLRVDLIIALILFLWTIIFAFYYTRVRPQCDYTILGWTTHDETISWDVSDICIRRQWLISSSHTSLLIPWWEHLITTTSHDQNIRRESLLSSHLLIWGGYN